MPRPTSNRAEGFFLGNGGDRFHQIGGDSRLVHISRRARSERALHHFLPLQHRHEDEFRSAPCAVQLPHHLKSRHIAHATSRMAMSGSRRGISLSAAAPLANFPCTSKSTSNRRPTVSSTPGLSSTSTRRTGDLGFLVPCISSTAQQL